MVKDQDYLKNKASYCLDLAKKLGATNISVNVGNSISEMVNFRNKKLDESNRSDNLGINSRLQWRFAPLSDFYLVYNDNYFASDIFAPKLRSLTFKLSYWFNI